MSVTTAAPALSRAAVERIRAVVARYPKAQAGLLPALWIVQEELGWVPPEAMVEVAGLTGSSPAHVYQVVSFYTLYDRAPRGRHKVQVCRTLSCAMAGAGSLCERLRERLGVGPGETSADGAFTWEPVECLAACGTGPVVQVDGEHYEHCTAESLDRVLDGVAGTAPAMSPDRATPPRAALGAPPWLAQWCGDEGPLPVAIYRSRGGYEALLGARKGPGSVVLDAVKASGIQGRGGAGFPTGTKWGFIPRDTTDPVYVVVNGDESEPGAFKDRALLELAPHLVLEGTLLACHAVGAKQAYVYLRGEFPEAHRAFGRAIEEARGLGVLGPGTGVEVILHRGAGAYICGEETALLESLEGKKGFPRLRPPFPAQKGLFQRPTVVNNVETLANVPGIVRAGASAFRAIGNAKSPGTKLVSISGAVRRPGLYEVPLGVPLWQIVTDVAGGAREGRQVKAVIPGGSSTPILTADEARDTAFDFDSLKAKGTFLGTGGIIVLDDRTCVVRALHNVARFYHHESCGQCTPCREGTGWTAHVLEAIERGDATTRELDQLAALAVAMRGRTICALADAVVGPVESYLKKFRPEFEAHLGGTGCPIPDALPEHTG